MTEIHEYWQVMNNSKLLERKTEKHKFQNVVALNWKLVRFQDTHWPGDRHVSRLILRRLAWPPMRGIDVEVEDAAALLKASKVGLGVRR